MKVYERRGVLANKDGWVGHGHGRRSGKYPYAESFGDVWRYADENSALDREYEMPSATAGIAPERASAILSQFDRKRRAAQLAVPTDDGRVRAKLREMGEPITLFGEGPGDRRDRLRELLTLLAEDAEADGVPVDTPMADGLEEDGQGDQEEEFYTEGIPELLQARRNIAKYSLPRAQARITRQREDSTIPLRTHIKHRKAIKERLQGFELYGTQIAGERPVSITRFSPNGEIIAAGNWSGGLKLLNVPNLDEKATLRGHTGIVGGISWFPGATLSTSNVSADSVNIASGAGGQGGKSEVHLWSLSQDTPISTLSGHTDRVCRVEFHPSGQYLASASFDTTWRLWDVETTTELLLQEGHSRQVYTVSFNTDGSLLASGGLDSIGRIWDLRTGRTVMILDGHIREIYSLAWGIDGYRVLSGSGDGWVKCWDIRAVKNVGGIGAHNGNVSDLRWFNGLDGDMTTPKDVKMENGEKQEVMPRKAGTFFVSSGFDKNVNIYSADDWSLAKQLSGHSGNVLSVDMSQDSKWIASSGHDRTVKLWGRDDGRGI
jgi:U4/U6 small nuclear ribonucleoprotein PRP4